jgi:hypothetical protein
VVGEVAVPSRGPGGARRPSKEKKGKDIMGRNLAPRIPILLALTEMNDSDLHDLAGRIKAVVGTSKLCQQNPAMAASAAAIATKDAALATENQTVADDKSKLHSDIAAEAVARTALVAEFRTYATWATNGAQNAADIHGAGLTSRDQSVPMLPPEVPGSVDVLPTKKHGRIRVSVHETGPTRHEYVAQQSLDGTNWTPLGIGHGKTRTLTGTTGTKIWVRFAMVRGELQSDWCTPVLVTIP